MVPGTTYRPADCGPTPPELAGGYLSIFDAESTVAIAEEFGDVADVVVLVKGTADECGASVCATGPEF